MKKFIFGFISGVLVMLIVIFGLYTIGKHDNNNGFIYYESSVKLEGNQSFQVFQTLDTKTALAIQKGQYGYSGLTVLILKEEGGLYDNQVVTPPKGYKYVITGTYCYPTKENGEKTVPVIELKKL